VIKRMMRLSLAFCCLAAAKVSAEPMMAHDMSHHHEHNHTLPSTSSREPNAYNDGFDFSNEIEHSHKEEVLMGAVLVDRLEAAGTGQESLMTYDWQAGYGKTFDRAVIRSEGNIDAGQFTEARNEILWGHGISAYWDSQLGVRYDSGKGPERAWLALGVQGLAPYWLYTEATFYVGEQGRVAFRLEFEYDVLITQRLVLQPRIETNIYSQNDVNRDVKAGLSDFEAGLRLRYEVYRELAPYLGVEWSTSHERSAVIETTRWVAGVQVWF